MSTGTNATGVGGTTDDYTDEALRERFDTVVLTTNPKNNKRLHLPDGDEPMCDTHFRRGELIEKSIDVYPLGWSEWCQRCLDALETSDNEPEVVDADEVDW
jgi:hypothetical protein